MEVRDLRERQPTTPHAEFATDAHRQYVLGESSLHIRFGDLTTSTAQVLVSSEDTELSMGGGVSAALRLAGGPEIARDASKHIPAVIGDVVVTTAGHLPAFHVFHVITRLPGPVEPPTSAGNAVPDPEVLRLAANRCLDLVDALGLESISFPALGAGTASYRYEDVALVMAEVIATRLETAARPLDVSIYLHDPGRTVGPVQFAAFFDGFTRALPKLRALQVPARSEAKTPIFVTYAHKDRDWLEEITTMLTPLVRNGELDLWDDSRIGAGSNWRDEIAKAIADSRIALALVSKNFLGSKFVLDEELPAIAEAAAQRGVKLCWVPVSASLYDQIPELETKQALHDPAHPLDTLDTGARNQALAEICRRLKVAIEQPT